MWDKLRMASDRFRLNQMELERDDSAGPALRRMSEILSAANPYGLLKEAEGLIGTVNEVNEGCFMSDGPGRLQESPNNLPA